MHHAADEADHAHARGRPMPTIKILGSNDLPRLGRRAMSGNPLNSK
jgi:hypothetical protein